MTDVLLTHSYLLSFDPKEHRAMMPYPPLATITAAAVLRDRGFTVALHDVMLEQSEESIREAIRRFRPRIVAIYDDCFNYLTKMCLTRMREAAFGMARIARAEGCTVVVFSSDATDHLDAYFRNNADIVLCGEADITLAEVTERLLRGGGRDILDIPGVAVSVEGSVRRSAPRKPLKDLDQLPIAAWDLVDVPRYRAVWMQRHGYFSLNLSTTRGCPFHCNWCAKPVYGQVYNSRSPEHVVREMELLRRHAQPDHLWITDDIFGLRPGWVRRFADVVNERSAVTPFKCLSRADLLLENDTIAHLKRAGCATVWIGAESGSQHILDAMDKGTTVGQIRTSTRLLHEAGIRVGFFLQFGYPGETWADIRRTMALVDECRPDEIGISVSYPLPGTPFYDRVISGMQDKQNWESSGDLDLMFPGAFSPAFYRTLHRAVHQRFSIARNTRRIARAFRPGRTSVRKILRSAAAVAYHSMRFPFTRTRLWSMRLFPRHDRSFSGHASHARP